LLIRVCLLDGFFSIVTFIYTYFFLIIVKKYLLEKNTYGGTQII